MRFFTFFLWLTTLLGMNVAQAVAVAGTVGGGTPWTQPANTASQPTLAESAPAAWSAFPLAASKRSHKVKFDVAGVFPYHYASYSFAHGPQEGSSTPATRAALEDAHFGTLALSLYPNPSRGYVTVQLRQRPGVDYKLRLNNVIGQEIRTLALRPDLGEPGMALNLTDLPGGVYFYSLLVDGKVASTKRLILQN